MNNGIFSCVQKNVMVGTVVLNLVLRNQLLYSFKRLIDALLFIFFSFSFLLLYIINTILTDSIVFNYRLMFLIKCFTYCSISLIQIILITIHATFGCIYTHYCFFNYCRLFIVLSHIVLIVSCIVQSCCLVKGQIPWAQGSQLILQYIQQILYSSLQLRSRLQFLVFTTAIYSSSSSSSLFVLRTSCSTPSIH